MSADASVGGGIGTARSRIPVTIARELMQRKPLAIPSSRCRCGVISRTPPARRLTRQSRWVVVQPVPGPPGSTAAAGGAAAGEPGQVWTRRPSCSAMGSAPLELRRLHRPARCPVGMGRSRRDGAAARRTAIVAPGRAGSGRPPAMPATSRLSRRPDPRMPTRRDRARFDFRCWSRLGCPGAPRAAAVGTPATARRCPHQRVRRAVRTDLRCGLDRSRCPSPGHCPRTGGVAAPSIWTPACAPIEAEWPPIDLGPSATTFVSS